VRGGARLVGDVRVTGAKNSVLKLMAASLLAPGRTTIADVPDWGDVRKRLDNVLGDQIEFGEEGAVTIVGHGIGSNPGVINKARSSAVGAGVPLNAVSVSPLRVTLWCDRQHVDPLTRALHKTFVE